MRLDELLAHVDVLEQRGDAGRVEVSAVVQDARDARPQSLFCCVVGKRADGHDFAADAVARGAVALLCERFVALDVVQARVRDVRSSVGPVASRLHGDPSSSMRVVGITGTNGKTTTAHLLASVFEQAGWQGATIGTLSGHGGPPTTPDAPALQAELARLRDEGCAAVAVEVSSHALDQHRVDGTRFACAVFTNLSQDHLDYHGTLDEYFAAKARLFTPELAEHAVVNVDDEYGRRLMDGIRIPATPFSAGDISDVRTGATGASFVWRGVPVSLPLGGDFNVLNALAAATAASVLGVDPPTIARGLGSARTVRGRFEPVVAGQPFTVVVDYAHTPDGLERVLASAREVAGEGRVVVVFGCGGERDRAKRPAMGRAAETGADLVVVTSDNPRSESPMAIIEEILGGMRSRPTVEEDRRAAIALAIGEARPGDVVVIAGKGHETTQVIGERVVAFDDREVAAEVLRERFGGAA